MIFDVEADGLLDAATKIHVLAYEQEGKILHTHDYQEMRDILSQADVLVGHNIILYDIPLLERILGIEIKARLIDTLAVSWYVNPYRNRHGLEWYGEDFGVPKPKVDDWQNLSREEYAHRCIEDVKINRKAWDQMQTKLLRIYEDQKGVDRLVNYLSFKLDCVRKQHESKWKLDKKRAERVLEELEGLKEEAYVTLVGAMPRVPVKAVKTRPAKPFKKDGSLSVTGSRWVKLLRDEGLPKDYDGEVTVITGWVDPKPTSSVQVKDWLFSLGWKPRSFDFKKDYETGVERQIPQVRVDGKSGKELCPSVIALIADHPEVEALAEWTTITHRISIFEGFLKAEKDGWLIADIGGLTNTLRFKHRVLVNLPGVDKPWGVDIRGSLIAPEGYELCGSDMCSLESTTKRHYMFPHDPDYVAEMSKPGFDEHLDLAKLAGEITQEDIDAYNREEAKWVAPIRKKFKPANYAGIYGVKELTLSRQTGLSKRECKELLEVYWNRNWSVKVISREVETKRVDGEGWLFNPVSQLWYSLRNEKDIFSTLNQGTGVFCFDSWIREFLRERPQLTGQFHDEVILCIKKGNREKCIKMLKGAILRVNDRLQLNVPLDVDIKFGDTYAEIH